MRVLFTLAGGRGHAEPLVPIAAAARAAAPPAPEQAVGRLERLAAEGASARRRGRA